MLVNLRIKDFAVIEEVELEFQRGLNVLTGETGAGKSIIVDAMSLLRGARGTADVIRTGADEAIIEAIFDLSQSPDATRVLEASGLPIGDELLIRRTLTRQGRTRVHINGNLSTTAILTQLGHQLFEISGQHEYQTLSDRTVQRTLLDALAAAPADITTMAAHFTHLKALAEQYQATFLDEQKRAERIDFLRFQIRELDEANLQPGEEDILEAKRLQLQRASDLIQAAASGEALLYSSDEAVISRLAGFERTLDGLKHVDPEFAVWTGQLKEARIGLEDLATSLGRYAQRIDLDPRQLEEVDERLALLHRLRRKHHATIDELIARREHMRSELSDLESLDSRRDELQKKIAACRSDALSQARTLSQKRAKAALKLSREVATVLTELGMPGATFVAEVSGVPAREGDPPTLCFDHPQLGTNGSQLTESGWDRVEFLFSANVGEDAKPMARVASGGELARLTLALKQVLGKYDPVPTSIYDEVDTGVSGAVADVVGQLLARVAKDRQVICVTHLPQVSAYAQTHFFVGKTRAQGRTFSHVKRLSKQERIDELARMLAAKEVTAQARANARALLDAAKI